MYSENPNGVFSAPNHHRSKTRTLHLSDKSQNGLYISEEIDKFEKEALSRRIHFLSDENQRLKSQLDGFDFEYSKLSREKAEENEFLQMGKLDLEREIITVKMKLEELSNEIDSQKEENQKLSEQNENLLQKIDELGKNYEKMKNTNQSLSLRIQNNSFHYNKEFETSQKAQENYNKKLSDVKLVYKKKIKSLKNDIKAFKITAKDLEASEQQRNDLLSEFEKYKTMIQTEQNKLLSDHSQQMKRLDELSLHKLNELENQLDFKLRTENDTLSQKFRFLQQEHQDLCEKFLEKERFFIRYKEDNERDYESIEKSLETLQRTNEGQRKKLLDQQERFSKDFDRNQREFEVFKHENELIQRDNEEKIRLSREELQRMAQRLQEKQQEISNLRSMLSQKMQELEIFFNNNQNLQEKSSETNRILLENDLLLSEKKEKAKIIDSLQAQNEALEFQALSNEDGIFATKEKLLLLQRELDSKNSDIYSLKASLNTSDQKLSLLKAEFSQTKEHNKRLEGEKLTMNNKLQECHLAMKNQERKAKEELSNLAKEFDERILVETNIYQRKLKETEAKIHEFEFRERYLKEEKDSKARLLFHKYQSFKEKSVIALKNIKQKLKEYRSLLISFEPAVIFENLSLEFQEKIIGFSGHLTRKIVMERNRVESFYNEERIMLKEKHQKESEDFSYNLKKKDENIQEMVKKDMMALKELENMNRSLINELNRIKPMLKNQEKELISAKNVIERFGKREEDSQSRLNKLEDNYHKEKTKGFNDLELLRNEVDELYSKNKLIFEEFTRNITSLKENQEEELRNMNKNYDEIIDVLKEKVRFYEENEELLNDDKNGQFEKRYEDAENQLKGIKRYYEEQITLLENTHSQILFQNTIETDKNLRNLALKSQEMEKLEAKLKDLENVLKSKNLIIEELSSKNSTIEGKFRNMQFQLELQNKHLNLKPVQISDELSLYKDEMLENPTLMPSNSFKSKHYSKISGMNPLNLEDKSDNFNKRINELKQLSHSISTNPMNTYKELPDEEKKGEPLLLAANMHRYSKSSSNFMQYANKFVGRANINGCNSQRDKVHSDKKATLHKNNQKSSLI